jgi:hypothetical protein
MLGRIIEAHPHPKTLDQGDIMGPARRAYTRKYAIIVRSPTPDKMPRPCGSLAPPYLGWLFPQFPYLSPDGLTKPWAMICSRFAAISIAYALGLLEPPISRAPSLLLISQQTASNVLDTVYIDTGRVWRRGALCFELMHEAQPASP